MRASLCLTLSLLGRRRLSPPGLCPDRTRHFGGNAQDRRSGALVRRLSGPRARDAGEDKTVAYIIDRFKAAGLQPGNKGSWVQDVPLVEITSGDVSPISFAGGKSALSLAYRTDMVVGTYRVTPKVAIKDSPVVFVGYGIVAPERGWNDYAGIDVKGKTVVVLVNDPIGRRRPGTGSSRAGR